MHKLGHVKVENMAGCRYAYANLDGSSFFQIGGNNHQGKSSFWKAIRAALEGKGALPPDPITEGEFDAEVTLQLKGETEAIPWPCTVTRTISRKDEGGYTTRVEITSDDGMRAPTPQTLLKELIGPGFGFDPLAWVRMKPKEQAEQVREILGVDFTEFDRNRQIAYDKRTEVNRQIKQLDGQIKGLTKTDSMPESRVDVAQLMQELDERLKHNTTVETNARRLEDYRKERESVVVEIAKLKKQIAECEAAIDSLDEKIAKGDEWVASNETLSTDDIRQKIASAEETNKRYDEVQECLALREKKAAKVREEKEFTKHIKRIDADKRKMVSEADFPVEGLGFGPDGIVKDGIAFQQLASSEQHRIAVALAIKSNPDFPVVVIQDGSLLDDDMRASVEKDIVELGGQCLIELVGHHDSAHIVFEEGVGKVAEVAK